jgi:MFS family permease
MLSLFSPPSAPPDALYSLRGGAVVLGAFCSYFFATGSQYCFGLIFVSMLNDASLGGSHLSTSWVLSIEFFFFLASGCVSGPLVASRGPRFAAFAGAALVTAGFALSSFVTNLVLLYVTYGLLVGAGCGLLNTAASFTVTQHFVERRAFALGTALAGGGLGAIVLAPVIQAAISKTGWRGALRQLAVLTACVLPLAALPFNAVKAAPLDSDLPAAAAEDSEDSESSQDSALLIIARSEAGSSSPTAAAPSFAAVLAYPPLIWFSMGCFLYTGCFFAVLENLAAFQIDAEPQGLGLNPETAAVLSSVQGANNIIGRMAIGAVADLPGVSKVALAQATMVLEALLLGGLVLAPRLREYAYVFAVVFGLCAGSVVALQPAIIAAIVPPELLAHALGFLYMFMSPSVLIVPTLAAVARDRAGGYRIVWEILPFVMAAGAAVLNGGWLIQWYRRRQTVQGE